jgi:hypothetical protein
MLRFLPLLIGVIVTPLSAAAHHATLVAQAGNESETAEVVEVFQGEHLLILTEGFYGGTYQSDGLSKVSVKMSSLEACKTEGAKWSKEKSNFRKGFKQYDCVPVR